MSWLYFIKKYPTGQRMLITITNKKENLFSRNLLRKLFQYKYITARKL